MSIDSNSASGWADFIKTPPSFNSTPHSQHILLSSSYQTTPPPEILETDISNLFSNLKIGDPAAYAGIVPSAASSQIPVDYLYENRTLLIENVHPETTEQEIKEMFSLQEKDSSLYQIHMDNISKGIVTVDYYDLRKSYSAIMKLNGKVLHNTIIKVDYAPQQADIDPKHPPNNGTIVVFHLPKKVTEDKIVATFSPFGEIRQVRMSPSKNEITAFIEYFDLRAAKKALNTKNGKYVMGARIKIEYSTPHSVRKKQQQRPIPHP